MNTSMLTEAENKNQRNDELRLKYSSFLLKGLVDLGIGMCASERLLCNPMV